MIDSISSAGPQQSAVAAAAQQIVGQAQQPAKKTHKAGSEAPSSTAAVEGQKSDSAHKVDTLA